MSNKQVKPDVTTTTEELKNNLFDLFDGVEKDYHFFGITGRLETFRPRNTEKDPYLMFMITGFSSKDADIRNVVASAMGYRGFGISLEDLRKHPDVVRWFGPTEEVREGKMALAYFLHGKETFIEVARKWWTEEEEQTRKEKAGNTIQKLRESAIRKQLLLDFPPMTEETAIQLVRYVPGKRFSIFDKKTGTAIYLSTDVKKIYVENIDEGHPLGETNPLGFFINRAALRNQEDDIPGDTDLGQRAYKVRCYLRAHPLIVEALKPRSSNTGEINQQATNVVEFPKQQEESSPGKAQLSKHSAAS